MQGEIKKKLLNDNYEQKMMVLICEKDRNRKEHYFVIEDMEEAKKILPSDWQKNLVPVFIKK